MKKERSKVLRGYAQHLRKTEYTDKALCGRLHDNVKEDDVDFVKLCFEIKTVQINTILKKNPAINFRYSNHEDIPIFYFVKSIEMFDALRESGVGNSVSITKHPNFLHNYSLAYIVLSSRVKVEKREYHQFLHQILPSTSKDKVTLSDEHVRLIRFLFVDAESFKPRLLIRLLFYALEYSEVEVKKYCLAHIKTFSIDSSRFISDLGEAVRSNKTKLVESICSTRQFNPFRKQNPAIKGGNGDSPLILEVRSIEILDVLMNHGVDISALDKEGRSALVIPDINYRIKLKLLRSGMKVDNRNYVAALHQAIGKWYAESITGERAELIRWVFKSIKSISIDDLVELLFYALKHEDKVVQTYCNNRIQDFKKPTHSFCYNFGIIVRHDLIDVVRKIVKTPLFKSIHKHNPAFIEDKKEREQTPLIFHVRTKQMLDVLRASGVDMNAKNSEGHSVLSAWQIRDNYTLLLALMHVGVESSQKEYHDILRHIIPSYRIDKSKVSKVRSQCIDTMIERIDDIPQPILVDLMIYALECDIKHLQYFCFNKIKDFTLKGSDCTSALYYAVWKNKLDFFKAYFLIMPKTDLLSPSVLCSAVLSAARHVDHMGLLVFFCESKRCDLNQSDSNGGRPMYYALRAYDDAKDETERRRAFDVVRYLKDKGARLEPFNVESDAFGGIKANWYRIINDESYHHKNVLEPQLILYLLDSGSKLSVLQPSDLFSVLKKMIDYRSDEFVLEKFLNYFFKALDLKKKNIVLAWFLGFLVESNQINLFKFCLESIEHNFDDLCMHDHYDYSKESKPMRLAHYLIKMLGYYKRYPGKKYEDLSKTYHDALTLILKSKPMLRVDFMFKPQYRSQLYRYTKKQNDNMFSLELHKINIIDQAVICEHLGLLKLLLSHPKYSAFVKCVNMKKPGNGVTLMHVAAHTGNIDMIRLLLEKNAMLNVEDSEGYTPLHYAAKFDRNVPAIKFMISKGANINAQSSASKTTPLETALNHKQVQVYKTLIGLAATITPQLINRVVSGYQYVAKGSRDLSEFTLLNYNSPFLSEHFVCLYPSKEEHKRVWIEGEQWHQQKRKASHQQYIKYKNKYKKSSPNLVYARVTFVVSDRAHEKKGHHGRKYIAFDLPLPDAPVTDNYEQSGFHVEDVYTSDDKKEKKGYQRYPGLLSDVLSTMPPKQTKIIKDQYANRQSDSFHRRFHCSERAMYAYLKSDKTLEALVCDVEDKMPISGLKFYAIILDIHSTRYLCADCQTSMYYMYSSTGEFVRKLVAEIKRYKYKVLTKTGTLKSIVRFSAEQPGKKQKRIQLSDCYDFHGFFGFDIKQYTNKKGMAVLQRDNSNVKYEQEEGKPFVNDKRLRIKH